ncbi:MAG: DUF4876 domain-containing protein [Ignavibacteria bacterium]|jgi:hypothetical protein
MKRAIHIILVIVGLASAACEEIVNIEEKPEASDRSTTYVIQVVDSTGTIQSVYGKDYVEGASVVIQSNLHNKQYTLDSDENGLVFLSGVVTGEYLISISRDVTAEEMEKAYGEKQYRRSLVNSETGIIELRADKNDTIKVPLDKLNVESTLIISEIYGSGPSDAGYYYHDKYVEIYNQSDEVQYLDGLIIARAYSYSPTGFSYVDDPDYIHSKYIWKFPGKGTDYPIEPGEFIVCAEDGMDHTINAENSIDLSNADFEFYKKDAPDVDYVNVRNMTMVYQPDGNDWIIGGTRDAIVLADFDSGSLIWDDELYLFPTSSVLDGVEYLYDPTELDEKKLYRGIDAGAAGGIEIYTGKTLERKIESNENGKIKLKDSNNSSLDFNIYSHPSPKTHNEL